MQNNNQTIVGEVMEYDSDSSDYDRMMDRGCCESSDSSDYDRMMDQADEEDRYYVHTDRIYSLADAMIETLYQDEDLFNLYMYASRNQPAAGVDPSMKYCRKFRKLQKKHFMSELYQLDPISDANVKNRLFNIISLVFFQMEHPTLIRKRSEDNLSGYISLYLNCREWSNVVTFQMGVMTTIPTSMSGAPKKPNLGIGKSLMNDFFREGEDVDIVNIRKIRAKNYIENPTIFIYENGYPKWIAFVDFLMDYIIKKIELIENPPVQTKSSRHV